MTTTERPEFRDKIRRALAEADHFKFESLEPWDYQRQTAAVLRAVASVCDDAGSKYASRALNDHAGAAFALMETFLHEANLAEYVATPCGVAACEPGGEPCTVHERLMAHAEGDHELCDHQAGANGSVALAVADALLGEATR